MKIKLKKLVIENFKGCRNLTIVFVDTTNIYGRNASGKTTVVDAFMWLLFDKDSTGATKFNIRPLSEDGKTVDNVEIKVEATLDIDGTPLVLSKTQKQNWVKKRGTDTAVLQGNANVYEVDGFPASEKEYKEKIASLVDEKLFALLSNPRSFAALPWKEQREILMKFSRITDTDVLATDLDKYIPISDEVAVAPIEKCIEKAKKAMAKLKDRQKELPARIDEASKSVVELPELADLELHRNALKEQLQDIQKQREDTGTAYKAVADLQAEIMAVKLEQGDLERKANDALRKTRNEAQEVYDVSQSKEHQLFRDKQQKEELLTDLRNRLTMQQSDKAALGERYKAVKAETMPEDATICPTCGQELPAEKAQEVRDGFEANKAARLKQIIADGNSAKAKCEAYEQRIAETEAAITETKAAWTAAMQTTSKAYEVLNAVPTGVDVAGTPEYIELSTKLKELETQLSAMDTGEGVKRALSAKETEVRAQLDEVNRKFALVDANARAEERIAELQAEQREVGQLVADQEQKIYLLEEFTRSKMEMLSGAINSQFRLVNFKLFDMQISGGTKETCEITVDGVPYSSLNSAAKMQAGLDVIGALSRLYGVLVPVWLDNRESVTSIPNVPGQVINLYVSPADETLRVEVV